jgi:cyanate permease
MAVVLGSCALLIGPGIALFGAIPPSIVAGGWYPKARGRAVGITYIPLFFALIPLPGLAIIQNFGLPAFFLSLAALHVLLLPFMFGVAAPPLVERSGEDPSETQVSAEHPIRSLVSRPIFWGIILGDGLMNAAAITCAFHIVPIAIESGTSHETAALLLSVHGGATIMGSLLAGFLCDRVGAARTLSLAGFGFAASWAIVSLTGWVPALLLAMLIMGTCAASVYPAVNVLVTQVFGEAKLARAMGLIGVFMLPFVFGIPPAAGWLRDVSGNYRFVITALMVASLLVGLKFLLMSRAIARGAGVPGAARV